MAPAGAPAVSTAEQRFGHAGFSGYHPVRLEPTGRLAIPATFRPAFGLQARLRAYLDEYLVLWTERAFPVAVEDMTASGTLVSPQARKNFHRTTQIVAVDRQGRLVIPPDLRERVGLTEQVVVVGAYDSLEIYSQEAYDDLDAGADGDLLLATYDGSPLGRA